MNQADESKIRMHIRGKAATYHLEPGELNGLLERSPTDAELNRVKDIIREEFGDVAFSTARVDGAPLLIWYRESSPAQPAPHRVV